MPLTSFLSALAESAPQSPDPQLLDLDGTLFVQLALFVLLAFLLTQILWKPYLRVKSERIRRVDGYREDAKKMDLEAQQRLAKIEADLAETRRVGSTDRARARAEAQAQEQRLLAEANAGAQKALAEAQARIETSLAKEKAGLMSRAEALGREAAERVLGRKVAS